MSEETLNKKDRHTFLLEWIKYLSSVAIFITGLLLASNWFQNYNALNILAEHLKSLSPGLDIHYTNMVLDEKTGEIEIKVYVKNVSDHDVFLPTPCMFFSDYNKNKESQVQLAGSDLPFGCEGVLVPPNPHPVDMSDETFGFGSMMSPGADLCIRINKPFPMGDNGELIPNKAVGIVMVAATVDAYVDTLHLAVDSLPVSCKKNTGEEVCSREKLAEQLDNNRYKTYRYLEQINTEFKVGPYGLKKDEYEKFCSQPF